MNKYIITALLAFAAMAARAEDVWLWPIKGQQAGEGILYRPQDYIGDEFNFDNLWQRFLVFKAKLNYQPGETRMQRLKRICSNFTI